MKIKRAVIIYILIIIILAVLLFGYFYYKPSVQYWGENASMSPYPSVSKIPIGCCERYGICEEGLMEEECAAGVIYYKFVEKGTCNPACGLICESDEFVCNTAAEQDEDCCKISIEWCDITQEGGREIPNRNICRSCCVYQTGFGWQDKSPCAGQDFYGCYQTNAPCRWICPASSPSPTPTLL